MHIPDGFLTPQVWRPHGSDRGGPYVLSEESIKTLKEKMVPLMGVCRFYFCRQMLNFPVIGGTSGILLGGVLARYVGAFAGAALSR